MAIDFSRWIPPVEKVSAWAEGIKSISMALLAAGPAVVIGAGIVNAVTSTAITVEPIKVPSAFAERGFTSDIATARLFDEISSFQRSSSSAKERVSILAKNQREGLEKMQAPVGRIDVRSIQDAIQDALGIKKDRISGDITVSRSDGDPAYHVRLRRLPGNHVLLDTKMRGEPEAVLKQTALAMIEIFDPHIAASIYWRNGDEENAMRLIETVLGTPLGDAEKYTLNLRAQIHLARKRYKAAEADLARITEIDPYFAPAHGTASWMHRAEGRFDLSLAEAEKTIELAPTKWWGTYQKAQTLRELRRNAEAEASFQRALALKPDSPGPYVQTAQFMVSLGKISDAIDIYRNGIFAYPNNAQLHSGYADLLMQEGQVERALREYDKVLEIDPKNQKAITRKLEIEKPAMHP